MKSDKQQICRHRKTGYEREYEGEQTANSVPFFVKKLGQRGIEYRNMHSKRKERKNVVEVH